VRNGQGRKKKTKVLVKPAGKKLLFDCDVIGKEKETERSAESRYERECSLDDLWVNEKLVIEHFTLSLKGSQTLFVLDRHS
jgi:hypothetical protein